VRVVLGQRNVRAVLAYAGSLVDKKLTSSRDEDDLSRELELTPSEGSFSLDAVDESAGSFDNGVPVEILVAGAPRYQALTHTRLTSLASKRVS
jgi:hypothetical protein